MQTDLRRVSVAVALGAAIAGCGARSGLLEPFRDEVQAGGRSGSGFGGTSATTAGQGGRFPSGGFPSISGTASISGAAAIAGGGAGGVPATCRLSLSDCAGPSEPECATERPACSGEPDFNERVNSGEGAYLSDVVVDREGRVVVAGYGLGTTRVAESSIVSPHPGIPQGLAASFTNDGGLQWLYGDSASESRGVSVEPAPNGDTVLQLVRTNAGTNAGSLLRLNGAGQVALREDWGNTGFTQPTALAMDNDGRTWSAGFFFNQLDYQGGGVTVGTSPVGYLLQVDPLLAMLQLRALTPDVSPNAKLTAMVVDDEDHVLALGEVTSPSLGFSGFLQKRGSDGELVFEKRYAPELAVRSVVVDRNMRSTVFGHFITSFENEGQRFATKDTGLFLAQYARDGELMWQKSYDGVSFASAAAVDPNGNLILAGYSTKIVMANRTLVAEHTGYPAAPGFGYVLKLRADGTEVWAENIDGNLGPTAVAADNAGQVWVVGSFDGQIWLGNASISINRTVGMLFRLRP
jgi:hypothetical protein